MYWPSAHGVQRAHRTSWASSPGKTWYVPAGHLLYCTQVLELERYKPGGHTHWSSVESRPGDVFPAGQESQASGVMTYMEAGWPGWASMPVERRTPRTSTWARGEEGPYRPDE
jgi:hypothetical protein